MEPLTLEQAANAYHKAQRFYILCNEAGCPVEDQEYYSRNIEFILDDLTSYFN